MFEVFSGKTIIFFPTINQLLSLEDYVISTITLFRSSSNIRRCSSSDWWFSNGRRPRKSSCIGKNSTYLYKYSNLCFYCIIWRCVRYRKVSPLQGGVWLPGGVSATGRCVRYREVCPLHGGVSATWRCVRYMEVCPLHGPLQGGGVSATWRCVRYMEVCPLHGGVSATCVRYREVCPLQGGVSATGRCVRYREVEVCPLHGGVSATWRCVRYMEVCPLHGGVSATWRCVR